MLHPIQALALIVSCGGPLIGHPALAQEPSDSATIHQLSREFSAAYVRGDAAAMAALYTADAVIFPERSAAITGRKAIERYWTFGSGRRGAALRRGGCSWTCGTAVQSSSDFTQ